MSKTRAFGNSSRERHFGANLFTVCVFLLRPLSTRAPTRTILARASDPLQPISSAAHVDSGAPTQAKKNEIASFQHADEGFGALAPTDFAPPEHSEGRATAKR